jgi:hypothetical protein
MTHKNKIEKVNNFMLDVGSLLDVPYNGQWPRDQ